ncbi:hypothetical protein FVEG_14586 [Fusarium verticillioides 7600]|uniref:Uncharacterized protein n=1 Tax=Gibberella moniliformis (strain M3125 / FGSC 7600) TaxID=334819 RepID=W7LBF2_GIBM7|nr:hypothetical protein FVEG_14586 [Fusarium verticillioides 7600]EWG35926.1 hypothetical protein FVEG_14586 [Fusarium verticillioides 7600]
MPVANISDILVLAQRLMESYKTLENWEKGLKIAEYALELIPAYVTRYLDGRLDNAVQPPNPISDEPTSGTAELTSRLEARKIVDDFMDSFGARLKPVNTGFTGFTRSGPILVINVSFRCDAFIIKHVVKTIPLPKLSEEDLEQRLRDGNLGSLNILEWLWDTIAAPILDHLGYSQMPSDEWPQIRWIPTGALSRFPLHAAGYHQDQAGSTVIDRVMLSYSSSPNAILEGVSKDKRTPLRRRL